MAAETPNALVDRAFARLAELRGFSSRPQQLHLARLISDLIAEEQCGVFEAPTGLGKSLATLVPAIANAILYKRRIVVATYTNVLAEQYWRSDLPLALSLFEDLNLPTTAFLMGRQRYACLDALDAAAPDLLSVVSRAEIGHETEVRLLLAPQKQSQIWRQIVTPPVCPARSCRFYNDCFYYGARKRAVDAQIVITNHSVVMQHALMTDRDERDGLLGDFDFLIIDEAHDFPLAAQNGLEFELSPARLRALLGIVGRIESAFRPLGLAEEESPFVTFRSELQGFVNDLVGLGLFMDRAGILECSPEVLSDHPQVKANWSAQLRGQVVQVADQLAEACGRFSRALDAILALKQDGAPDLVRRITDEVRNYRAYVNEMSRASGALFGSEGVAVTYLGRDGQDPMVRQDVIGLAEPLDRLIWKKTPYVCVSATASLDGTFNFFKRLTGSEPDFEEILPSPFDHGSQAAVYLPKAGVVPDPSEARKQGREEAYFDRIARELEQIISLCRGRTLALFHSRREMEAVFGRMHVSPEFPIHLHHKQNAAGVGERFRKETASSLFALRSFWTGFDAPGETLSCVALVRVPFEVPVEPPQIARMAYLQHLGMNPFAEHTLPLAKMLMRQGVGRLIRSTSDKGLVALLDPRLRSKRYGEEILENLPAGMRVFDDVEDAVGFLGL